MYSITASEIKQNSTLLQKALKYDVLITKRDKPFVVILDYERYKSLIHKEKNKENWIDETFSTMTKQQASDLLNDIQTSRVNKEIDSWF